MIDFATSMIGHWHGGLGLAGVMACALFAAVSGSSPATVVAIGSIILPAVVAPGFPKRFGAGVVPPSGGLRILFPPSIVMVIYFVATEAAAVSAVYAFVIAVFIYKDMSLSDVPKVLLASANMSAMLLYIITNAVLFSFLMANEQIPQAMTSWIVESGVGWIGFLLL